MRKLVNTPVAFIALVVIYIYSAYMSDFQILDSIPDLPDSVPPLFLFANRVIYPFSSFSLGTDFGFLDKMIVSTIYSIIIPIAITYVIAGLFRLVIRVPKNILLLTTQTFSILASYIAWLILLANINYPIISGIAMFIGLNVAFINLPKSFEDMRSDSEEDNILYRKSYKFIFHYTLPAIFACIVISKVAAFYSNINPNLAYKSAFPLYEFANSTLYPYAEGLRTIDYSGFGRLWRISLFGALFAAIFQFMIGGILLYFNKFDNKTTCKFTTIISIPFLYIVWLILTHIFGWPILSAIIMVLVAANTLGIFNETIDAERCKKCSAIDTLALGFHKLASVSYKVEYENGKGYLYATYIYNFEQRCSKCNAVTRLTSTIKEKIKAKTVYGNRIYPTIETENLKESYIDLYNRVAKSRANLDSETYIINECTNNLHKMNNQSRKELEAYIEEVRSTHKERLIHHDGLKKELAEIKETLASVPHKVVKPQQTVVTEGEGETPVKKDYRSNRDKGCKYYDNGVCERMNGQSCTNSGDPVFWTCPFKNYPEYKD